MTPQEMEKLPKPLERTMTALETSIMAEVVERIKQTTEVTPLIDQKLNRLQAIGTSKSRIRSLIADALKETDTHIDDVYRQAVESDYIRHRELYKATGRDYLPYEENTWLKQVVEAVKQQTKDTLRPMENITQTTGFNVMLGKKRIFTPLSEYLERSLDKVIMGIASGTHTYSQAINEVIQEMTNSGLRLNGTIDYASGKSDRIEVAARRAVMTGVAQLTDKVNEKNAKDLNTNYWEVDWHMGARNTGTGYRNHQSWQGKVYDEQGMKMVCGCGEMLGFAGINCYHIRFPFIPEISKRKYTDEWLAEQNRKENKKKSFKGREYDTYGALQYQRKLERTLRKQKQDVKLLEKGGADKDDIIVAKSRMRLTEQTYVKFSKDMGLAQQRERLTIVKAKSRVSERENSPRKSTAGEYGVNWKKVQDPTYRSSLEKLSDNPKVVDTIETRARWALNNRDGKNTEELYAVSLDTGNEIASIIKQNIPSGVMRTDIFTRKLNEADQAKENVLLIHNHPKGLPPSLGDINVLHRNKNVSGITVGHDGSIYYYTRPKETIADSEFQVALRKYSRYTEVTGMEKALEDLMEKYGFIFRKL